MTFFRPDYFVDSISDLPLELLIYNDIKLILLDIDDTLTKRDDQNIDSKTLNWIQTMQKNGFKLFLISNNFFERVKPFADKIGLPFLHLSGKPLPISFLWALFKTRTKRKNALIIGDQIFADILGANLIGVKSVLVEPRSTSKKFFMKIKRIIESHIKSNLKKINFD